MPTICIDDIEFIKNNIKIEELVSHLIPIAKSKTGINYYGKCPFHPDTKGKFYVNPIKQNFGCPICNFYGDIFKFIQKYYNLNFETAFQYLVLTNEFAHERYGYHGKGMVYVLKLVEDKYYVGYTEHYCDRMHSHFSGNGSEWTKEYNPVEIYKVYKNANEQFETDLTIIYMIIFGYSRVRGGDHAFPDLKYDEVKEGFNNRTKEGVYILLLQNNKFYIGYALNTDSEIKKHFDGRGCDWTQKYSPLKVYDIRKTRDITETERVTLDFIRKYGWENVRGHHWDKINSKPPK